MHKTMGTLVLAFALGVLTLGPTPSSAQVAAAAKVAANEQAGQGIVQEVRRRHWRGGHRYAYRRHWRHRHYGYRHYPRWRYYPYYSSYYYPYYGYYPYRYYRRPGISLYFRF